MQIRTLVIHPPHRVRRERATTVARVGTDDLDSAPRNGAGPLYGRPLSQRGRHDTTLRRVITVTARELPWCQDHRTRHCRVHHSQPIEPDCPGNEWDVCPYHLPYCAECATDVEGADGPYSAPA